MLVLSRWSVFSFALWGACKGSGSDSGGGEGDADTDTDADTCGDGVTTGSEECDDGGESKDCDADCTHVVCGDATVNKTAGEICEPATDQPWDRCALCTVYGAGLDGTFGDAWEDLTYPAGKWDGFDGFQSFHYSGESSLFEFTTNQRYDIAADSWTAITGDLPWKDQYWTNGAVDSTSIFVPRTKSMHVFDMASETWTTLEGAIPDGSVQEGAAVFDGAGTIWYEGPDALVAYDPVAGTYVEHDHPKFDVYETRVAYDPWGDRIVFGGFENDRFLIYDIASGKVTESSPNPGGLILDSTCGDNSGSVYTGASKYEHMYRYDVALDTWEVLPDLPALLDNDSTCVVSQDGWLYYITRNGAFARLSLGTTGN